MDQVALELYTVREQAAADFPGTLRAVAEAGYRAVEFAGTHGLATGELRATLDGLGLRAMGAHIALDRFLEDAGQAIAEAKELGCAYAVVPWLAPERRGSGAATRELAGTLNRIGERCRAEGIALAYHNHEFEFDPLPDEDGKTMLDLLVEGTDPALVGFELDIGWVVVAGHDPLALMARLKGRVPLLHLKDLAPGSDGADAPVGEGTIDWAPILAAPSTAGVNWYVVEQDKPADALADVATSLRNLERLADGVRTGFDAC